MVVDAESVSKQRSMFESLRSTLVWASGLEMETALMSCDAQAFTSSLGALGRGGGLFRGELFFHAKTNGTAPSTYVNLPTPRLFFVFFLEVKGTYFRGICDREVFTCISLYRV